MVVVVMVVGLLLLLVLVLMLRPVRRLWTVGRVIHAELVPTLAQTEGSSDAMRGRLVPEFLVCCCVDASAERFGAVS